MLELEAGSCVACGAPPSRTWTVAETMFRQGREFEYGECSGCGSLQIESVPDDLGAFYGGDSYYSFNSTGRAARRGVLMSTPVRALAGVSSRVYLSSGWGKGPVWARVAGLRVGDSVLDLGCGDGKDLRKLKFYGFRRLLGADPFLSGDRWATDGVRLLSRRHDEIEGRFDCVLMNHSFEHVADPHAVLSSVRRLLEPGGVLVLRMPVKDCEAWDVYGVDWVQLDAPRHLVVYSHKGLETILASHGFSIRALEHDSWAFQFWGSELVRQGRPHSDGPGSFSAAELRSWQRRSQRLNRAGRGDSVLAVCEVGSGRTGPSS